MSDDRHSIELEIQVPGTPEEVWAAIATGPGITSWYVPHTVEEREGGAATASFGEGPEMTVPGRVAVWEPPVRIVFDGGEGVGGLAFEWQIEARDDGTCVVRLVNTGFGSGGEWDGQYDAMTDGWQMFLFNLALHMRHFRGQRAIPMLPTATWTGPREDAFAALTTALGIRSDIGIGERVEVSGSAPELAGTVAAAAPWRLALLVDRPTPATAILAAEGSGDQVSVSVWIYVYGEQAARVIAHDAPRWQQWLDAHAAAPAG